MHEAEYQVSCNADETQIVKTCVEADFMSSQTDLRQYDRVQNDIPGIADSC